MKKQETKTEEKHEAKKEEKKVEKRKTLDYALVNGLNLGISPKSSIHICDMIRGRTVDTAIKMLEEVTQYKRVIKMNNREVPHKHGKGVMAGKYPIEAVKEFIRLVKNLKATAIYNELDLDKCIISCKADKASRPFRRGGARFKRAHVMLKLTKRIETKNQNKTQNKDSNKKPEAKK